MSMPSVMIATTNTGLPIIGRSATRSTPMPSSAVSASATSTATKKFISSTR